MNLSLSEAARLLGKSDRQVRYLIKIGQLPARKENGRWRIRRQDLPLSPGQERAAQHKSERAVHLVPEVAGIEDVSPKKGGYSIQRMRAFQEGAALYRELTAELCSPRQYGRRRFKSDVGATNPNGVS